MKLFDTWKSCAKKLKTETYALFLAYKDQRVPWYAKVFVAIVVGYALSPIDLIPDFIPILGYLDDLILIPLGISIALKMIPREVMVECRKKAEKMIGTKRPENRIAAIIIVLIWIVVLALIILLIVRGLNG